MIVAYLASPYSHPDPVVRLERFEAACRAAAKLMCEGYAIFAPIVHSHPVSLQMGPGNATDHGFWLRQDIPWLRRADKLIVLKLPGWKESRGVEYELKIAMAIDLDVSFMEPV